MFDLLNFRIFRVKITISTRLKPSIKPRAPPIFESNSTKLQSCFSDIEFTNYKNKLIWQIMGAIMVVLIWRKIKLFSWYSVPITSASRILVEMNSENLALKKCWIIFQQNNYQYQTCSTLQQIVLESETCEHLLFLSTKFILTIPFYKMGQIDEKIAKIMILKL